MKRQKALIFRKLWLAVSLLAALAQAQEMTSSSPYAALVVVAQQSPAEFQRGASVGLAEVLARISGRADVAAQPALNQALAAADRYVDQFRYERGADGALVLKLQFAPAMIDSLLRGAAGGLQASAGAVDAVVLRVEGVASFADYAQLLGYLNRLGSQAAPQSVEGDVVTLSVHPRAGVDQLMRQLSADRRLLELPAIIADGSASIARSYRWQRVGG